MADITWSIPSDYQTVTSPVQTVVNVSDMTAVKQVAAGTTGTVAVTTNISAAPMGDLKMTVVVKASSDIVVVPDPTGTPDPTPTGSDPKSIQIGSATLAIDAINPTSTAYPGGRGPNQLILYRSPVTITVTNQYGTEVQVNSSNVITAVIDRQASASGTGTSVPSGGYVLSGHGTARDWLNTNAIVGATVILLTAVNPDPTPPPTGGGGGGGGGGGSTSAYPVKAIAVYKMMWSSSPAAAIGSMQSSINVIRLAFAQNNPPSMVGYGPEGQSALNSAIATRVAAGARIIVSVGGAGGSLTISDRNGFIQGIDNIKTALNGNVHGVDWDAEGPSMAQSDVVWICQQLKSKYGSGFAISMAPNGGNVGTYLPIAVACYKAGALDDYGQQFYDASVSLSAAKGRISDAIGAGLPQSVMSVGMMIASDSNHWTNAQCRDYMTSIRQQWPGITKAYLWEASRAGTSQWASDMAAVIGV